MSHRRVEPRDDEREAKASAATTRIAVTVSSIALRRLLRDAALRSTSYSASSNGMCSISILLDRQHALVALLRDLGEAPAIGRLPSRC
jgi:hypothetical protein